MRFLYGVDVLLAVIQMGGSGWVEDGLCGGKEDRRGGNSYSARENISS